MFIAYFHSSCRWFTAVQYWWYNILDAITGTVAHIGLYTLRACIRILRGTFFRDYIENKQYTSVRRGHPEYRYRKCAKPAGRPGNTPVTFWELTALPYPLTSGKETTSSISKNLFRSRPFQTRSSARGLRIIPDVWQGQGMPIALGYTDVYYARLLCVCRMQAKMACHWGLKADSEGLPSTVAIRIWARCWVGVCGCFPASCSLLFPHFPYSEWHILTFIVFVFLLRFCKILTGMLKMSPKSFDRLWAHCSSVWATARLSYRPQPSYA